VHVNFLYIFARLLCMTERNGLRWTFAFTCKKSTKRKCNTSPSTVVVS